MNKVSQATVFKLLGSLTKNIAPKLTEFAGVAEKGFAKNWDEGIKALKPYASQKFTKGVDGKMTAGSHTPGWLSSGIADGFHLADAAKKSPIKGTGKFLWDQVKSSRFKSVDLNDSKSIFGVNRVVERNGKKFLQGKGPLAGNKFFDREILGHDASGKAILKKRLPVQVGAVSMTPLGFGATTAAFGTGSPGKRAKDGAVDTALWAGARPVAEAKMFYDMF